MQQTGPTRAKLTRPRLHQAVARERLFRKLDEAGERHPAVCVVGPPGAGKTTLVASWCDARGTKGIWYQVDAGDADLATFFFYLGEATRPFLRKGQRRLPALTPEYLQDVAGFSRRFFRDLFALLPADACVVLDNYQEVPADSRFHQIVADAVREVPEAGSLIVISRRDPPNCYARLIANENVAFVDWEDLRLTVEETRAIIAGRGLLTDKEIERLHAESGGWAAGITLMLEGRRRSLNAVPDGLAERDVLFEYFAAQIFEQVPEATRRFLVITALLPQVPVSIAREITGNTTAGEILEGLYERHLFTHRRAGAEPTYWYHALFRGFLLLHSERMLDPAQRAQSQRQAGRLLEAQGALDDAFVLFRQAQDWDAVGRLAARHAEDLLGQGRGQTLREWILALPPDRLEEDPWLRYWLGISLIPVDQREAHTHLEAVYHAFAARGERSGEALCAASVVDTYCFEWSDFRHLGAWVERLEPLVAARLFAQSPKRELKVQASLMIGILYGSPAHFALDKTADRVSEMLDENLDTNGKVNAGAYLLTYCNLTGRLDRGRAVLERVAPLLGSPQVTPLNELWWYLRLGHYQTMLGNLDAARTTLQRVRTVADMHGLTGLRSATLLGRSYELVVASMQHEPETVKRLISETESLVQPGRPMDTFHLHDARMYLATLTRDKQALCRGGPLSYAAAQAEGMVYTQVLSLVRWAHGLAIAETWDELRECLRRVRELIAGTFLTYFECEAKLLEAFVAIKCASARAAEDALFAALEYARETSFHYPNNVRFSSVLPTVLERAIETEFCAEYAVQIVRRYKLRPTRLDSPAWPWPVKLHTLGRFEVELDGVPLRFSAKPPRKPLALLKAIVAHGCSDVSQPKLVDALWPNEDGDAGKQSFGVTMVRLRKLLGVHDAILVSDERVSLNPTLCWVDARAFEANVRRSASFTMHDEALACMRSALALYAGPFLPTDSDEPWTVPMRLRLRTLFTSAVEDLGRQHEACGSWDTAIACYRRGLEADDLVEEFYVGQMRCYLALQRPAEGMAIFRRLRQMLSVVLGVTPSPASAALARVLTEAGQASADVSLHR